MPGLATLAVAESRFTRDGATTMARRLSLLRDPHRSSRPHWAIENSLKWVLHTNFDEDRARNSKDHAPANLTIPRKLAPNV